MNKLILLFILLFWNIIVIGQNTLAFSEKYNSNKEIMLQIDSIRNTMEVLQQSDKCDELVKKQKEILDLSKRVFGVESPELASEYHFLGYYLSQCENYKEALNFVLMSAEIYRKLGVPYISEYLSVLEKIGIYHYMLNEMDGALQAYKIVLDEYDHYKIQIDEDFLYILNTSLQICIQYNLKGNLDKSIHYLITSQLADEEKFNLLSKIILYYVNKNQPTEAIKLFEYANKIVSGHIELSKLEVWGDILLHVVNAYISYGDYYNANEKLILAEKVYSLLGNVNANKYYIYLSLGNIRYAQEQFMDAYKEYALAIDMLSSSDSTNLQRAYLYSQQANCMLILNEREKATVLIEKAMEIIEGKCQYASTVLISIYNTYSTVMFAKGKFYVLETKLKNLKETCIIDDNLLELIDLKIGLICARTGRFVQAVDIADALIAKLPEEAKVSIMHKDEFEEYLKRIVSLGTIYSLSYRLANSIHLLKKAYRQCESCMYNTGEVYGVLLNNLSLYNIYLGNNIEAKQYADIALAYWQKNINQYNNHLFETYTNLFMLSIYMEDEEHITMYAKKSFETMQNVQGVSFSEIQPFVSNLLKYYILVGDFETATTISKYIKSEASLLYGEGTKSYYDAVSVNIYLYIALHDLNSIVSLSDAILSFFDDDIHLKRAPFYYALLDAFIEKGDVEKVTEIIVETYRHELKKVRLFASDFDTQERLYLLNEIQNHLISKCCSFLLNTQMPSTNKKIIIETIFNSTLLYKGLNLHIDKNVNNGILQLKIPNMLEVSSCLKDDECAIEFVNYYNGVNEYGALILDSHNECHFVPISTEQLLVSVDILDRYNNPNYSNLIWGNILPYIYDKTTIYFSPCGELHNIAIEQLSSFKNDDTMSDDYQIIRLSSTRMLLDEMHKTQIKSIALFGGMDYDKAPGNVFEYHSEPNAFSVKDTNKLLRGMNYKKLPGTLEEVNQIDSIFNCRKLMSIKYTGTEASEKAFKLLSGNYISIIHVATHGVYWNEEYNKDSNKWLSILKCDTYLYDKNNESYTLSRSALLFSGAQNTLMGQEVNDNNEDGILTAFELSKIDMRKVDLVVLSACQTGLGDIKGDGVFGLQRGFKKAGVNSLLMSLWDVDDNATQLLMVTFYQNLLSGKSKQESLHLAQKTLRQSGNYNDPYYWAGFILLDGLN